MRIIHREVGVIRLRTPFSGALLCVVVAQGALAQGEAREPRRWQRPEVGLNVALGLGRGQFQQFVDAAVGFGGYGSLPVALHGGLALRADLSVLYHEFDTWSGFPPIETKSYITSFRAGPQLAVGMGRVRLYGFGAGGFSYFATDAAYDTRCDCVFNTTLQDDWTWATEIGGGLRIALGGSDASVALDFGVRALRNGKATYVTQGGVTQNSDGSFTIRPHTSEAHLLVMQVGVSGAVR